MKLQIVAIRDSKADAFGQPNFVVSIGSAVRSFTDETNRQGADNMLYRHPDDFVLYHLGTYDDMHAEFDLLKNPVILARGDTVAIRSE